MKKQLFWLHIKKSAGITTRSLLVPHYVEVDRVNMPKNFIQAKPEEYNDILNNHRVVLGEYQFKRCLFAKQYLYRDQWDSIYSFAFSREPCQRCVSMFYYLFYKDYGLVKNTLRSIKRTIRERSFYNTSYAFDMFLDYVVEARESDSIYSPFGTRFTTHTAPMWDDITDLSGNVLLKDVYRLENLLEGLNRAFEVCGIDKKVEVNDKYLNKNKGNKKYIPNVSQKNKIENLYRDDFELYERAR